MKAEAKARGLALDDITAKKNSVLWKAPLELISTQFFSFGTGSRICRLILMTATSALPIVKVLHDKLGQLTWRF